MGSLKALVMLRRKEVGDARSPIESVRMMAVLLQAGATPTAAWAHLAEVDVPEAALVVREVERGLDHASAIRAHAGVWREVSAVWSIAAAVGAPLGDALRSIADALQDAESTADDVRIALAEPASTARLMLWLPLVGLVLGMAMGFDTLRIAATNPIGLGCVVAGGLLLVAARSWTRALVRRAQPPTVIPGMHAELLAVALSGGASIPRAQQLVAEEELEGADADDGASRALHLSRTAGVPAVELLRAEAAHQRRAARVRGRIDAARLASRLLLPLGVCTLPAFLLLGVAPLVLSVLTTTPLPLAP